MGYPQEDPKKKKAPPVAGGQAPAVPEYDREQADNARLAQTARNLRSQGKAGLTAARKDLRGRGLAGSGLEAALIARQNADILRGVQSTQQELAINRQNTDEQNAEAARTRAHERDIVGMQTGTQRDVAGIESGGRVNVAEIETGSRERMHEKDIEQQRVEFAGRLGLDKDRLTLDQDALQFEYDKIDKAMEQAVLDKDFAEQQRLGQERHALDIQAKTFEESGRTRAWESSENAERYAHEARQAREQLDFKYTNLQGQLDQAAAANDVQLQMQIQQQMTDLTMQRNDLSSKEYEAEQARQFTGELEQLRHQQSMGQMSWEAEMRLAELETELFARQSGAREEAMFGIIADNNAGNWGMAGAQLDAHNQQTMARFMADLGITMMDLEYQYGKRAAQWAGNQGGGGDGGGGFGWGDALNLATTGVNAWSAWNNSKGDS